jgi:anti-sigma factor RsiW
MGRNEDLNLLIDGEITIAAEHALLDHLAGCQRCAADMAGLLALRGRLARIAPIEPVPEALALQIAHAVTSPAPEKAAMRTRSIRWVAAGTLLLAASLMLLLFPRHNAEPALQAVLDTSMRQNIAPSSLVLADTRVGGAAAWFRRHHLAVMPVPDLSAVGFKFEGCRTDVVDGHRASILVYGSSSGPMTVLAWPEHAEVRHRPRIALSGDQVTTYWQNGKLEFWAISKSKENLVRFTDAYRKPV